MCTILMTTTVVRLNKIHTHLFFAFWCFAIGAIGQDIDRKVSVSFEDEPLPKVLSYLSEHHSIQFSYSKEQIPFETKISLNLDSVTVKELLSEICDQADLEYKFIDGLVVIRRKISSTTFVKQHNNFANLKGVVLDSASGQPLPFANVFFDNSSFGMSADSTGKFILNNVPIELHRLVVSYVGYQTLTTTVTLKAGIDLQMIIKLIPIAKQLTDVVVIGKREKGWADDFEEFKTEILGGTINARLCTIQNPNAVQLERTKSSSYVQRRVVSTQTMDSRTIELRKAYYVLTANTSEPLEIENQALGYRMKVLIEKFRSYQDSSSFLFYIHYDTLEASSESERFRWELNRLNAYSGSQMHLFRSILHNQTEQEGFEVCEQNGTVLHVFPNGKVKLQPYYENFSLKVKGSENEACGMQAALSDGQYLVRYNRVLIHENSNDLSFPSSIIGVKKSLTIDASGIATTSSDYWRSGYFDKQRIADRLPNDYDEFKSRARILSYEAKRIGDLE
ncbi:MAG TPA: carboxypeptidase-like regulatory domain-containing protein, partial [Cyclobacteriaceae bacterium]|nr:carboxypeptidase-like regulatory domain-containing protein [Cyclobacteriaceae bacterium]